MKEPPTLTNPTRIPPKIQKITELKLSDPSITGDTLGKFIHNIFVKEPIYTGEWDIFGTDYKLRGFLDPGADCSLCNTSIYDALPQFQEKRKRNSGIYARGYDGNSVRLLDQCLLVPMNVAYFSWRSGKYYQRKRHIRLWSVPDQNMKNEVLLGRGALKVLNVSVVNKSAVSEAVYKAYTKSQDFIAPEDEHASELFEKIEYRYQGDPGIYKIKDNAVFALRDEAAKSLKNEANYVRVSMIDVDAVKEEFQAAIAAEADEITAMIEKFQEKELQLIEAKRKIREIHNNAEEKKNSFNLDNHPYYNYPHIVQLSRELTALGAEYSANIEKEAEEILGDLMVQHLPHEMQQSPNKKLREEPLIAEIDGNYKLRDSTVLKVTKKKEEIINYSMRYKSFILMILTLFLLLIQPVGDIVAPNDIGDISGDISSIFKTTPIYDIAPVYIHAVSPEVFGSFNNNSEETKALNETLFVSKGAFNSSSTVDPSLTVDATATLSKGYLADKLKNGAKHTTNSAIDSSIVSKEEKLNDIFNGEPQTPTADEYEAISIEADETVADIECISWNSLEDYNLGLLTQEDVVVLDDIQLCEIAPILNDQSPINIIGYGDEINDADKKYIWNALKDSQGVWKGREWDVGEMKVPPMRVDVKDERKCKLFPAYKFTDTDRVILGEEIKYWLKRDICRWMRTGDRIVHSSPAFVVHRVLGRRADGSLIVQSRVVVNFTLLNSNTFLFVHKNPTIEDIHLKISGYYRYNATDIHKYFYHIPIHPESRKYMGISVPNGVLVVSRVYQGLTNAPIYGHMLTTELYKNTDVIPLQDDLVGGVELIYQKPPQKTQYEKDIELFASDIHASHQPPIVSTKSQSYDVVQEEIAIKSIAITHSTEDTTPKEPSAYELPLAQLNSKRWRVFDCAAVKTSRENKTLVVNRIETKLKSESIVNQEKDTADILIHEENHREAFSELKCDDLYSLKDVTTMIQRNKTDADKLWSNTADKSIHNYEPSAAHKKANEDVSVGLFSDAVTSGGVHSHNSVLDRSLSNGADLHQTSITNNVTPVATDTQRIATQEDVLVNDSTSEDACSFANRSLMGAEAVNNEAEVTNIKDATVAHILTEHDRIPDYAATKKRGLDNFIAMIKRADSIGLKLNARKTVLYELLVEFTGFTVSADGLIPLPRNRTNILRFPYSRLKTKSDWQSFEGAIIFLNEYIIDLSMDLMHLRHLMISQSDIAIAKQNYPRMKIKDRNKKIRLRHSAESKALFEIMLDKVANIRMLHHADVSGSGGVFLVKADACLYGLGASLWQSRGKQMVLIKLWSKQFTDSQLSYGSTEREALAIYLTMIHWKRYLLIKPFILRGDHKPLQNIYNMNWKRCSNYKLLRWVADLQEYRFEFQYVKGDSMDIALEDYLSRMCCSKPTQKNTANVYQIEIEASSGDFRLESDFKASYASIDLVEIQSVNEANIFAAHCTDDNLMMNTYNYNSVLAFKRSCNIENLLKIQRQEDITRNPAFAHQLNALLLNDSNIDELDTSIHDLRYNDKMKDNEELSDAAIAYIQMIHGQHVEGLYSMNTLSFDYFKYIELKESITQICGQIMYHREQMIESVKPPKLNNTERIMVRDITDYMKKVALNYDKFINILMTSMQDIDVLRREKIILNVIFECYDKIKILFTEENENILSPVITRAQRKARCAECDKPVLYDDAHPCCRDCGQWFHLQCVCERNTHLNLFRTHPENIDFVCKECNKSADHKINTLLPMKSIIKRDNAALNENIDLNNGSNDNNEEKIRNTEMDNMDASKDNTESKEMIESKEAIAEDAKEASAADTNLKKAYLFKTNDDIIQIFRGKKKQDFIDLIRSCQYCEFPVVLRYLQSGILDPLPSIDMMQEDYVLNDKLFTKLSLDNNGIILIDERILVPSRLRGAIWLHYHQSNNHQNALELVESKFIWVGMKKDIELFEKQCLCKILNKKAVYGADRSVQYHPYNPTAPNEVVYMDIYGPLPDNKSILVLIDGFDAYTQMHLLESITGINIIKCILFRWIYILGWIGQIISDNATNFISKLCRLFYVTMNITKKDLFSYSPWANSAEIQMKKIGKILKMDIIYQHIKLLKRGIVGTTLEDIIVTDVARYEPLIAALPFKHNNTINPNTGYTPNQMRFNGGVNISVFDMYLKMYNMKYIEPAKYIRSDGIDFKEYMRLCTEQMKAIEKIVNLKRFKTYIKKMQRIYCDKNNKFRFKKGDYVLFFPKTKSVSKYIIPYHFGWVITKIEDNDGKNINLKVTILNIFSKEEIRTSEKHLMHFHKSLFEAEAMIKENNLVNDAEIDAEIEEEMIEN